MNNGAPGSIPVYSSLDEITDFGSVVGSIGNFDGVHLGHRKILSAVVSEARERGMRAVAITFDPHPERFLRSGKAISNCFYPPSTSASSCWRRQGMDAVLVLP